MLLILGACTPVPPEAPPPPEPVEPELSASCRVKNFKKSTNTALEDAWLAASTYHDFNYPIQKWENWMTDFLKKNFHTDGSNLEIYLDQPDLKKETNQLHSRIYQTKLGIRKSASLSLHSLSQRGMEKIFREGKG